MSWQQPAANSPARVPAMQNSDKPSASGTAAASSLDRALHPETPHSSQGLADPNRSRPWHVDDSWALGELDLQLVELLESITLRIQAGETVSVDQVASEYPAWARQIRSLLPALSSSIPGTERKRYRSRR